MCVHFIQKHDDCSEENYSIRYSKNNNNTNEKTKSWNLKGNQNSGNFIPT